MVPVSHVLWGAVWLGIASDAMSKAQTLVRKKARAALGVVPRSAQKLNEVSAKLQMLKNEVHSLAAEHDALHAAGDFTWLSSLPFALKINNLKLTASRLVAEIAHDALNICGIEAYKNNSAFSMGRNLRDALSAALMIHNDRIAQTNESLLLVQKGT
jgi:acyl-CoA dehydrogenase